MPAKTKTVKEKVTIAAPTPNQASVAHANVDEAQVLKAFKALSAHVAKKSKDTDPSSSSALPLDGPQGNLRDPSNSVYVQITINNLHKEAKVKPVRINLPNALHLPGSTTVCLLVKDPQRQYKDLLVEEKIKCISRVVGVTKLKGKFKPFEARRALVQDHDLFLADDRIVPMIPTLCGKVFFDAKKNPITVNVQKKGAALKQELESAIQSTTYLQNKGICTTIKIGYMASHTPQQLTENLLAALPAIITRIKGGWENIHNIEVKTGNSAALPIWNQTLGIKTHLLPGFKETKLEEQRLAKEAKDRPSAKAVAAPPVNGTPVKKPRASKATSPAAAVPTEAAQQEKAASPKKPSPRKTRSAAAQVKAANSVSASAAATPTKTPSATPRKAASSTSRSAKKTKA